MSSDDIRLSVEVDTGRGVRSLDELRDSTRDAGEAIGDLERKAETADTTVKVDVELDDAKARNAADRLDDLDRKGRGAAGGLGFSTNAFRDLTGPLGDVATQAGDFGDSFEGLGDIAAGVAGKLGLSAEAAGKLSGVMSGVGVVVAAAVTAWTLYRGAQQQARQEAERMLTVQTLIADREFVDAAKKLAEQYGGTLRALEGFGLGTRDFVTLLRGQDQPLTQLRDRYREVTAALREFDSFDAADQDRAAELMAEEQELRKLIGNLEDYRAAWRGSSEDLLANSRYVDELTVLLGGVTEEAQAARDTVREIGDAFETLTRTLDDQSAIEDVRDAFDNVKDAAEKAWTAGAEGGDAADRAMRDYQQAIRDAIAKVLGLQTELDNIPDETIAAIAVAVENEDLTTARRLLEDVAKDLPPVRVAIDTENMTAQLREWARTVGPGSNSGGPGAPPPGVRVNPNQSGNVIGGNGFFVERGAPVIVNYYPPAIDPFGVTQASEQYVRVQRGPGGT